MKINPVEAALMLMITGLADLVQFFLDFLDGGTISSFIINPPMFFLTQFWLFLKGIKGFSNIAGNMVEFVPIINALPIRTATLAMTIYLANKPELAKIAGMASKKVGLSPQEKAEKERQSLLADKHYLPEPDKAWNEI